MFTVEMLPAQRGDCLWLTYGTEDDLHHVLIDAGPREVSSELVPHLVERINALGTAKGRVELLVISHVDADHIAGVVRLLAQENMLPAFRDVWFNAYKHLPNAILGAAEGEILTRQLEGSGRWNRAFGGEDAAVVMPEGKPAKPVKIRGGLKITLLSPTLAKLAKMAPRWERDCAKAGLIEGKGAEAPPQWSRILGTDPVEELVKNKFKKDPEPPNGSSIAFIAEYDGKRVLLAADAHADVLAESLALMGPGPHDFAAVKVSHHGSSKNTSPALLSLIRSPLWLFSSNGANFNHPNDECVARVISTQKRPTLAFNYTTEFNERWATDGAKATWKYKVRYPKKNAAGLLVQLA